MTARTVTREFLPPRQQKMVKLFFDNDLEPNALFLFEPENVTKELKVAYLYTRYYIIGHSTLYQRTIQIKKSF